MAGFFGLFDFTKPGKGISKDQAQKRSFFLFFQYYFENFWRFCYYSIVYCIISLPLITSGIANVGLTNIVRSIARDKHSFGLSDFFDSVKKNWKQGLICGIINTVVYSFLIFNLVYFFSIENQTVKSIGIGAMILIYIFFTIINFYIWTMMITFNYKLKDLYKNAFRFTFIALWRNLLCFILVNLTIIAVFSILLVNMNWALTVVFFLIVCLLPTFLSLMVQFFVFPVLEKYIIIPYYKQNPDADIFLRESLGIVIPPDEDEDENYSQEESQEDDDSIFTD